YPNMVVPLFVGREKSIEALESAMKADKQIVLVAQKNPAQDDPGPVDLYTVGTLATILQLLRLPDGTVKVLVEGGDRVSIDSAEEVDGHYRVAVSIYDEEKLDKTLADSLMKAASEHFE